MQSSDDKETAFTDPVCKMKVFPSKAAAKYTWDAVTYYFCNPRCKEMFQSDPQKYLSVVPATLSRMDSPAKRGLDPDPTELKVYYLPESAFEYICPMDPEVRQKEPGSCPKCGMALLPSIAIAESGDESVELIGLKTRLLPSALLTVALLAISMPAMLTPGMHLHANGSKMDSYMPWLQLALASPVVLWGGYPIFQKALIAMRERQMNMFTLIAFGVSISYTISLASTFLPAAAGEPGKILYFESAASIITLVLVGQILELKARTKSGKALESLFALAPSRARKEIDGGAIDEISVLDIKKGDRLRVLPGDKIPADGLILSGRSSINESLLTGNAVPVSKAEGERVYASTINGDGSLLVQAETLGRDTVFAQIVELLSSAQNSRSPMQLVADRVSAIFIPSVLLIAGITFITWLTLGGASALPHAIQNLVAVLVIACPCALGLATPLAVSNAVTRASSLGLMVKDARALEMLASASDILIDKTGTLTLGKFQIVEIVSDGKLSDDRILYYAASLEQMSKHPLAVSICASARARSIEAAQAQEVINYPGLGLAGVVDNHRVLVGNAKFMLEHGLNIQNSSLEESRRADSSDTEVILALDSTIVALIALADELKDEATEFIKELRQLALRPEIMSGDGKKSVANAAAKLGISDEDIQFDLLPQGKVAEIRKLQADKRVVAMLGDGVNDAAALAAADAGIAMASGSDVAISSAAISMMHADLRLIPRGIRLARLMVATMKENLFLAFVYNAIALLLATGILYPSLGIELNPAIAAAAMSLSSLSVILNSMKISKAKL